MRSQIWELKPVDHTKAGEGSADFCPHPVSANPPHHPPASAEIHGLLTFLLVQPGALIHYSVPSKCNKAEHECRRVAACNEKKWNPVPSCKKWDTPPPLMRRSMR